MKISKEIFAIMVLVFILSSTRSAYLQDLPANDFTGRFNEICTIVENNFYNPGIIKERFPEIKREASAKLTGVKSENDFSRLINTMLDGLKTSHTHYYTKDEPEYYQIASIFQHLPVIKKLFNDREIKYSSIGIMTGNIDGKTFITGVLEGGTGEKAGLLRGDEIISANGKTFTPSEILKNTPGEPVAFVIRRQKDGETQKINIVPEIINPLKEFKRAVEKSVRVIKSGDRKIAYIHLWCYAGEEFHNMLKDTLETEEVRNADALIWDLRDGWGGANAEYLNIFNEKVPASTAIGRNGARYTVDTQWRKPVVMLTNEGSRSGKEILAYGFKKYKIGKLLGKEPPGQLPVGGSSLQRIKISFTWRLSGLKLTEPGLRVTVLSLISESPPVFHTPPGKICKQKKLWNTL